MSEGRVVCEHSAVSAGRECCEQHIVLPSAPNPVCAYRESAVNTDSAVHGEDTVNRGNAVHGKCSEKSQCSEKVLYIMQCHAENCQPRQCVHGESTVNAGSGVQVERIVNSSSAAQEESTANPSGGVHGERTVNQEMLFRLSVLCTQAVPLRGVM